MAEALAVGLPDVVAEAANEAGVDPWEVADELAARGMSRQAASFVQAVRTPIERQELEIALTTKALLGTGGDEARQVLRAAMVLQAPAERESALRAAVQGLPSEASALRARVLREHASVLTVLERDASEQIAAWRRVLEVAQALSWSRLELVAAHRAAQACMDAERFDEAEEFLQDAVWLVRGREALPEAGDVLFASGVGYAMRGEYELARLRFLDAAHCFKTSGVGKGEAHALAYLGGLLGSIGRMADGLVLLDRSEALARPSGDVFLTSAIQSRRAEIYEAAALYGKARECLDAERTALAQATPSQLTPPREARLAGNLHRIAFLERKYAEADELLQRAEAIFARADRVHESRSCLVHRAWLEAETQLSDATIAGLVAATGVAPETTSHEEQLTLLEALARCRVRQSRFKEAADLLARAVTHSKALDKHSTLRVDVFGSYGLALLNSGDVTGALAAFDTYVDGLVGNADEVSVASTRTYRGILASESLAAAVEAARAAKDADRLWRYTEAARAIRLLAALGGRSALGSAAVPPQLVAELDAALLAHAQARRAEAVAGRSGSAATVEEKRALGAQVASAAAVRDSVAARLVLARSAGIGLALGAETPLLSKTRLQSELARDGSEAVLSLSRTSKDELLAILVLREGDLRVTTHSGAASVVESAQALRRYADPRWLARQPPPSSSAERRDRAERPGQLLATLRQELSSVLHLPPGIRSLHVVPHAELAYLPYNAIWPDLDVQVVPCASLIPVLRQPDRRADAPALALGVGSYRAGPLLAEASGLAALSQSEHRGGDVSALGDLPHAAAEARSVAGSRGVALVDEAATAHALVGHLTRASGRRWSTIHFACHGIINADLPTLSGVALFDAVLTAQEIHALRLDTDMVVLSACDTATDAYVVGEGVAGLVRSFFHAGAPRVIASLWKVPDEPTAILMARFYELLARDRALPPAAALRAAQSHVRTTEGGRWASPVNWAAWIAWGAK